MTTTPQPLSKSVTFKQVSLLTKIPFTKRRLKSMCLTSYLLRVMFLQLVTQATRKKTASGPNRG